MMAGMNPIRACVILGLCIILLPSGYSWGNESDNGTPASRFKGKNLLVLGDSITFGGDYVVELELAFRTRFPLDNTVVWNLGLPSETISGLSEEGHAGGNFPRPDLAERLDRVMKRLKPDVVFSCYGMNCGIYKPLSSGNLGPYLAGYEKLASLCRAMDAELVISTPPPFDPLPIIGRVTADGNGGPFSGYDRVLETFSLALMQSSLTPLPIADINTNLTDFVTGRRISSPDFTLAGDGVHMNALGHHLAFETIADAIGLDTPIDVKLPTASGTILIDDRTIPIPDGLNMPIQSIEAFNQQFNSHKFIGVENFEVIRVTFDAGKVAHDRTIIDLITKKHQILKDLWLTETGHKRPGMRKLEPFDDWNSKADDLESQIREAISTRPQVQIRFQ